MERNRSLDGLKYILIVLVVLGHFIEPSRYDNHLSGWLYSVIYSFHMPLFIWMSGYFYKHRDTAEEFRRSLPLLEVCLISHIGFALLRGGSLSLRGLISFTYSPSWYLLSLFCWRMVSSFLFRSLSIRTLLMCSIVIEVLSFIFINKYGGFLSLMRTLQFYPYFIAGYMMKNKLGNINRRGKLILQSGGIAIIFILLTSSRLQHQVDFQRAGLLELSSMTNQSVVSLFFFRYAVIASSVIISGAILIQASGSSIVKKCPCMDREHCLSIFLKHLFTLSYRDIIFSFTSLWR